MKSLDFWIPRFPGFRPTARKCFGTVCSRHKTVCANIFSVSFSHSLVKTVDCIKSSNGNESMMFCALAEIFFGLVVAVVVVVVPL